MGLWFTRIFDLDKINAVSDTLAGMLERHAPGEKWGNPKLVELGFRDMLTHAKGEKRKHGWGGIKVAVLTNRLLWKLVAKGYPKDFSKEISTRLAILLAQDINTVKNAPTALKKIPTSNKRR